MSVIFALILTWLFKSIKPGIIYMGIKSLLLECYEILGYRRNISANKSDLFQTILSVNTEAR